MGMKVHWVTGQGPDGKPEFSKAPLNVPGRHNFTQGVVHRLKITNIDDHPGLELYPTIEVMPGNAKTKEFLAHSAVLVGFTDLDIQDVANGSYVTKVIYFPDPKFQGDAWPGIEEILTTRFDPGRDPVREASRRGSVLLVVRMGNRQE